MKKLMVIVGLVVILSSIVYVGLVEAARPERGNSQVIVAENDIVAIGYPSSSGAVTVVEPSVDGVVHVSLTVTTWNLNNTNPSYDDDYVVLEVRFQDKDSGAFVSSAMVLEPGLNTLEFDAVGNGVQAPWRLYGQNLEPCSLCSSSDLLVGYNYTMTYPIP